jgi:hypothetical protein
VESGRGEARSRTDLTPPRARLLRQSIGRYFDSVSVRCHGITELGMLPTLISIRSPFMLTWSGQAMVVPCAGIPIRSWACRKKGDAGGGDGMSPGAYEHSQC